MENFLIKWMPDWILRLGIKHICKLRLKEIQTGGVEQNFKQMQNWHKHIKNSPIALETQAANDQHYEVPAKFYELSLGKNLKYSSAVWGESCKTLDDAEALMLKTTMQRMEIGNHQRILELGCGWGSLTLAMASAYPQTHITAVSNSHSQRRYIYKKAEALGLSNITIVTSDMNDYDFPNSTFDRVVSVEMFEHMRNWKKLMSNIATSLKDDGKCFVHIFTHKTTGYAYEIKDNTDWMSQYFFTGGQMPSAYQFSYFQDDLQIEKQWAVSGTHYEKTANAWLDNMDNNKGEILNLFNSTYGKEASLWFARWRVFYMSCAELFGFDNGNEWFVSHYLFKKKKSEFSGELSQSA